MMRGFESGFSGLGKLDDVPIVLICRDDTEAARLFPGHRHNGDSKVGIVLDVRLQHLAVIHTIEMVTGKDEDVLGVMKLDVIQILGDQSVGAGMFKPSWGIGLETPALRSSKSQASPEPT